MTDAQFTELKGLLHQLLTKLDRPQQGDTLEQAKTVPPPAQDVLREPNHHDETIAATPDLAKRDRA